MSIHRSLAGDSALVRHRNVLTRGERLAKLEEDGRWKEGEGILGLPKVRNLKIVIKKKKKAKDEDEAAEAAAFEGEDAGDQADAGKEKE